MCLHIMSEQLHTILFLKSTHLLMHWAEEYLFTNATGCLDGKHKVPDTSFLDNIPGLSSVLHGIFGQEKTTLNLRHLNLFNSFLGVRKREVTIYS